VDRLIGLDAEVEADEDQRGTDRGHLALFLAAIPVPEAPEHNGGGEDVAPADFLHLVSYRRGLRKRTPIAKRAATEVRMMRAAAWLVVIVLPGPDAPAVEGLAGIRRRGSPR